MHIEFSTVSKCPNACSFCPQEALASVYPTLGAATLGFGTFCTILSKIPKSVAIHFSGFVEPLINREVDKMMLAAAAKGHQVSVYTTLVGLNQSVVDVFSLILPSICIHVPDRSGLIIVDDVWIRLHSLFYKNALSADYVVIGDRMTKAVEEHLTTLGISVRTPPVLSRAGNVSKPPSHSGTFVRCSMNRWHDNVVLPNGDVVLCCMDYGLEAKLGNLLFDSWDTIFFAAEKFKNTMDHNHTICSRCEWAVFQ